MKLYVARLHIEALAGAGYSGWDEKTNAFAADRTGPSWTHWPGLRRAFLFDDIGDPRKFGRWFQPPLQLLYRFGWSLPGQGSVLLWLE